ncbi:hypothetical protein HXX76_004670 [Chlamydomonas incerta]|uniref:PH domain-containing protein n=1 Tax=Chlamydomonas incerta TaxID=51695 RepID=A0A835TJ16_CHLIN|nr:hypothetical protein HXX76_004670 [Chlamydomonas incerta]|eukprot:KAG2439311.1 hypothetical protein HXX76_004670 [Chlamydomonas incerta]
MEMGSVTGLGGETATLDLSKGLTPHYYFNFGVYLQVVGERRSTRAEERVLHFDLNFGALKLLAKESLKLTIKLDVINQIIFDDSEPRTVLISCHDDRRYLLDFQNPEENLLFRTAYAAVVENTFDISTFNRSLLLKGPVQKKKMRGFQDRYLILVPRKLYILSSKTSIYPRSVLSLLDANPRYDEARGTVHLDVMGKEYVFRATGGGGGGGGGEGHSREETLEWFVALAHGCGLPPMFMEDDGGNGPSRGSGGGGGGGGGGYGPSQFQQQPWHQAPTRDGGPGPGPGRSPRGPGSVASTAGFGPYGGGGGGGYYGGGDGAVSEAGSVRTAASRYTTGGFSYTAGPGGGGAAGGGGGGSPVVQAYARLGSIKSYRHTAGSPSFLKRSATGTGPRPGPGGPPTGSVSGPSGSHAAIPLPGMPPHARDRGGDDRGGVAAWHAAPMMAQSPGGGGGSGPRPPPGGDVGGDGNGGGNGGGGYRSPGVSPGRLARNGSLPGPLPLRAGLARAGRNGSMPGPGNAPAQPGVEVAYRFEGVTGPAPTASPPSFYDRHTATTARGIMRDKANTSPWLTDTGGPQDGTPRPRTPPAPRRAASPQSQHSHHAHQQSQHHQPAHQQRAYLPRSGGADNRGGGGGGGGGGYQSQQRGHGGDGNGFGGGDGGGGGGGYGHDGGGCGGYIPDYVAEVYGTDVDGLDEDPDEYEYGYQYGRYAASDGGRAGADRPPHRGGGGRGSEAARRPRSKVPRGGSGGVGGGDSSDVSSRDAKPPRRRGSADDRGNGRGVETPSPPAPAPQVRHGSASSTGSGGSSGHGATAAAAAASGRYASPLGSRSAHKASLPTVYERGDTDGESARPSPQQNHYHASPLASAAAAAGAARLNGYPVQSAPLHGSPPVAGGVPLPPPPPPPPGLSGPDPFELLADIQARLRSLSAESNAAAEAAEVAAKLGGDVRGGGGAAAAAGPNGGLSAAAVAALNAAAAATHVAPTTEGRTAAAPWSHSPLPYQARNTTGEDVTSTWLRNRQMSAWSTGTTDYASIMTPLQAQQALARAVAEPSGAPLPTHASIAGTAAAADLNGTAVAPPGYGSASGSSASGLGGYAGGSISAAGRGMPLTSLSAINGLPAAAGATASGEPWRAPAQSLGTLAAAAAAARGVGLGGPNAWRLRSEVIDTPLLKPSVIARNNSYLRGRINSIANGPGGPGRVAAADPLWGHRRGMALLQWTFANYESLLRDSRNMEPQVLLAAADDEMSSSQSASSGPGGGPQSTLFRSRRDRIASALTDWVHVRRAQPSLPWAPRAQPRGSAATASPASPRHLQPQERQRSPAERALEARRQQDDSARRSPGWSPVRRTPAGARQEQQRQPSPQQGRRGTYSSCYSDTDADADAGREAGRGRDDGRQRRGVDKRRAGRDAAGSDGENLDLELRHHETLDLDFDMTGVERGSDLLDTCDSDFPTLSAQHAAGAGGGHGLFAAAQPQPQGYSHVAAPTARVSGSGVAGGSSSTSGGGHAAVLELQQDISSVMPGMSLTLRVKRPNSPSAAATAATAGAAAAHPAPAPGFSFRPASPVSHMAGGAATPGRTTPNARPASPPHPQHALQQQHHHQHYQQAPEGAVTWSQLHSLLQTHLYGGGSSGSGNNSGGGAPAGAHSAAVASSGSRAAWDGPVSAASAPDGPAARALAAALLAPSMAAAPAPGSATTSAGGAPMSPTGEVYRPISNPLFHFSSAEASPDAPDYDGRGDVYTQHQHQPQYAGGAPEADDGNSFGRGGGGASGDIAVLLRALQQAGLALPADDTAVAALLQAGAQRDTRSQPPHSPPRAAPRAVSPPHPQRQHPHHPHHPHHQQPDLKLYLGSPAAAPASPARRPSISPMTPEASRSIQHAAAMAAEAATSAVTEAMSALGRIGSSYRAAAGGSEGSSPPRLSAGLAAAAAAAAPAWRHDGDAGRAEQSAEAGWRSREWERELEAEAAATATLQHGAGGSEGGGADGCQEGGGRWAAFARGDVDATAELRDVGNSDEGDVPSDSHRGGGGSAAAATASGMAYRAQSLQSLLQLVNTGRVPHEQLLGLLAHGGLSSVLRQQPQAQQPPPQQQQQPRQWQ